MTTKEPENKVESKVTTTSKNTIEIKYVKSGKLNKPVDAEMVWEAIKGAGTNNKKLRSILCHRTEHEIGKIIKFYQKHYKRDMIKDIFYDTSGDYRKLMMFMLMPKHYLNAKMVKWAVKGLGTKEYILNDVFMLATNKDFSLMKLAYDLEYGKMKKKVPKKPKKNEKHHIKYHYLWEKDTFDRFAPKLFILSKKGSKVNLKKRIRTIPNRGTLKKDVNDDTSGNYRRTLLTLLEADRAEEETVNEDIARGDSVDMYKAGEGRLGTNDKLFITILTKRSPQQIKGICEFYPNISKKSKTLQQAIRSETSGDYKNILIGLTNTRLEYRVKMIRDSVEGLGTNDTRLMYLIVSCPFHDRAKLVGEYKKVLNRDLVKDIKGDTSGEYKLTLIELLTP